MQRRDSSAAQNGLGLINFIDTLRTREGSPRRNISYGS